MNFKQVQISSRSYYCVHFITKCSKSGLRV